MYETVITQVSNNKPTVKPNLLKYKSHNTISIPKQFIEKQRTSSTCMITITYTKLSLARPTLFVHCHALQRLRAHTSRRIKRSSGCYHSRRYRLRLFRTATARCACTPRNARSYTCALVWILTKTVFVSASIDIIRVSASVTVMVESKQQTWTKQSLPQRYLCVGCQLKSDQALKSLCLKGHVRARGSTLWRHRWQEANEFLCTKAPLFGGSWAIKNMAQKPGNVLFNALLM